MTIERTLQCAPTWMRPWTRRTAAVLLVLAAVLQAACGGGVRAEGATGEEERAAEGYVRVINVEVRPVEERPFTEEVRLTGTVQAGRDVTVAAEESGVVREILVEKGHRVRGGQPILRLDDEILRAQVEQAEATAAIAQETWERRRRLYEEDGVGSELVYLQAKYSAQQAAANLRLLRERLARTVVRAPIAGILENRLVEVGSTVAPGTPVARVVDIDEVKVTAGMPERYAPDIQVGSPVEVRFDVLDDGAHRGSISYVGATINPRNRTFPIELRLPNPGLRIKPEMVAEVAVERRKLPSAVVIPQEALVRVEEGFVVFVIEEAGGVSVAASRPVELGPAQGNEVVVRQGLGAGERLIVTGQQSLAPGDRVRVVGEG